MDKRRYVSRSPNCVKKPKGISADETGNAAADGYSVRHREPLDRRNRSNYSEDFVSPTLMDENEVEYGGSFYGDY